MNLRRLLSVGLACAVLALVGTTGASAALQTGFALGPDWTISPKSGIATIPGEAFCTEPANATLTGTLTQRNTSQTTMITLACGGGEGEGAPFMLTFVGFRPGPATLHVSATACNNGGCAFAGTPLFSIMLRPLH